MSRTLKTISMTLDPGSIEHAIKEVEKFEKDLRDGLRGLVEALMQEGVHVAKMQIMALPAIDTGALLESIGMGAYDERTQSGVIYAGGYYAFFVEYGTGIVGKDNPHPGLESGEMNNPAVLGMNGNVYDGYDSQGHGENGWVYYDHGKWKWTLGMPSRPFMYNTLMTLLDRAAEKGGEIIATYVT